MTAAECRRAVLVLNSYTRWGCEELLDMDVGELNDWLGAIPLVYKRN